VDRTVPALVLTFALGIAAAHSATAAMAIGLALTCVIALALPWTGSAVRARLPSPFQKRIPWVLVIVAACLGWLRALPLPLDRQGALSSILGEQPLPIILEGAVVNAPDSPEPTREGDPAPWSRIGVRADAVLGAGALHPVVGSALVLADDPPLRLHPGDHVRVVGVARRMRDSGNRGVIEYPDGREGPIVLVVAEGPGSVTVMARAPPFDLAVLAFRLRAAMLEALRSGFSPPQRGVLEAILLGRKDSMHPDRIAEFRLSGTWHVMVVSGLHIALAGGAAAWIAARLGAGLRGRAVAALAVAGTYAVVTGLGAPAFRALVALSLALLAPLARRRVDPLHALAVGVGWLLWEEPRLLFMPGFQLTVAAVLGLLRLAPGVGSVLFARRRFLARFPMTRPRGLRLVAGNALEAGLPSALAAWAATAPITVHHFGVLSLMGPVANLLVVPQALALLVVSPFLVLFALCGELPAAMANGIVGVQASLLEVSVSYCAAIPGAWMPVPPSGVVPVGLCAGILTTLGVVGVRSRLSLGLLVTAPLVFAIAPVAAPPDRPSALVLDAGHGLCVLLRSGPTKILVDIGGRVPEVTARSLLPALRAEGAFPLDLVVISHEDSDHAGGLPELLALLPVRAVAVPEGLGRSRTGRLALDAADRAGVPVMRMAAGMRINLEGCVLDFLQPSRGTADAGTANDGSLVLRWRAPGLDVLLPGDLEDPGLRHLLDAKCDLRADLLLLPHHGSSRVRLTPLLAAATRARVLVAADGASTGAFDTLPVPGPPVYLRTSRDGSVLVEGHHGEPPPGVERPPPRIRIRGEDR
jgi:competence protein ComEC